jgi:dethiobiotin synthase
MSHGKLRGVFITGIDTEIGKTEIACGLAWFLRKNEIKVGVMKPFATSSKIYSKDYKSQDTAKLAKAAGVGDPDETLNPVFFPLAASPLVAAEISHKPINLKKVIEKFMFLKKKYDFIVVEGIGGVMVPITHKVSLLHVVRKMNLPVIIVSRPKLGSINHTVMTINACREFKVPIVGIIFNQMPIRPNIVESMTPFYIERLTKTKTLSVIPFMDKCNFKKIGSYLRDIELMKYITSSSKIKYVR